MNASELAAKLLQWEALKRQLDELELSIEADVIHIGKSQTVGNVRAAYSAGRKTYDYQGAAIAHDLISDDVVAPFAKTVVDWKAVCEQHSVVVPFTQGDPSVTIKLIG